MMCKAHMMDRVHDEREPGVPRVLDGDGGTLRKPRTGYGDSDRVVALASVL